MPESAPKVRAQAGATPPADDQWAARLRGLGLLGILITLAIPFAGPGVIGAILVLLWVHFSRTPWPEIGYVRPKNWIITLAIGTVFGTSFKFLMKAIVMPLLGADPINHTYHYLVGNRAALLPMIVFVTLSGGFGEETVYRGFLFQRFGKLFGVGPGPKALTVLITSIWFALMHYRDQGLVGVEQAVITGLVFGTIFALTGRIFMLMFAHAAFDVAAIAIIYYNLEFKIAHLFFK